MVRLGERANRKQGKPAMQDKPESLIPTMPELMVRIEQVIAASVANEVMEEDVASAISEIFTTGADGDPFTLLAVARGCHAAAEVRRSQGEQQQARLLHSMAQDMLGMAAEVLAVVMAADVHLSGYTRH